LWHTLLIAAVVLLGVWIPSAEYTVLNVALPRIEETLNASSESLALIVDAFGISMTGLLIYAGAIADKFGRRWLFSIGLFVMFIGACGAALSSSTNELIAMRALMGVGGACEVPCVLSTLDSLFPSEAQHKMVSSVYNAMIALGVVVGPLFGGWAVQHLGLHWIFWGTAIAAGVLLPGSLIVPNEKNPKAHLPELRSVLSITFGLAFLMWGVIEAPSYGWISRVDVAIGVGLALLCYFHHRQSRAAKHPLIDRAFVADRRVWGAAGGIFVAYLVVGGTLFVVSPLLQVVMGYSPLAAGARQIPAAALAVVGSVMVMWLEARRPLIQIIVTGFGLFVIAEFVLVHLDVRSGYSLVLWTLMLGGLGWGLVAARMGTVVVGQLPKGAATGAGCDETVRQGPLMIGVAIASSLTNFLYHGRLATLAPSLPPAIAGPVREGVAAGATAANMMYQKAKSANDVAGEVQAAHVGAVVNSAYVHAVVGVAWTWAGALLLTIVVAIATAIRFTRRRTAAAHGQAPVTTMSADEPTAAATSTVAVAASPGFDPIRWEVEAIYAQVTHAGADWGSAAGSPWWWCGLRAVVALSGDPSSGRWAVLPANVASGELRRLEAAGLQVGHLTEGDELFRWVWLPEGFDLVLRWDLREVVLRDARGRPLAGISYYQPPPDANGLSGRRWAGMGRAVYALTDNHVLQADGLRWLAGRFAENGEVWLPASEYVAQLLSNVAAWRTTPDGMLRGVRLPPGWRLDCESFPWWVGIVDDRNHLWGAIHYNASVIEGDWVCLVPVATVEATA
jgi:MFS family permease